VFKSIHFVTAERQSSHRTTLALPIRVPNSLFHFPSFVNSDNHQWGNWGAA